MDEEELLKRFTDCVYFLASPLTCKKGIECEYRHSEIARLNPRDCWYWLGGSCFNPACAFRHPPLEGYKEALSESAVPQHGPSLPANKANVSCYFYWSGFCSKGDRCSFLHEAVDDMHGWKSSVAAFTENNVVLPSEKKLSAGSKTGSTPVERHADSSKTARIEPVYTETKPKQDPQLIQLVSKLAERKASPDTSATQCKETAFGAGPLLPAEGFVHSESDVLTDQSSDEQVDGHVEREDWLESSPGFDVLVEGDSENLGYEVDADERELDIHYVEYDCEDRSRYEPAYSESVHLLRKENYDAYDRLEDKQTCDYLSKLTGQSRESIFCRLSSHKRNFLQVRPIFDGRRAQDLREHLKKRKVVDDHFVGRFSGKHDSQRQVDRQVSLRRHGSRGEYGVGYRGRFSKATRLNRSRQQRFREKRPGKPHLLASEISSSRMPAEQQKRPSQKETAIFTGPKTLDQIREEKKKAQKNGDFPSIPGSLSNTTAASNDFQGPKPLDEILKNKRRLGSVVNYCSN